MTDAARPAVQIDTSKPHPARMYDWFLGGKDNYPVDEEMARQLLTIDARGRDMARVNRAFMHRATRWLGTQAGIRQYLDIGTGIPTEPNLHQIAQQVAPEARIVYCDNDPIVLAHAEALLLLHPGGRHLLHPGRRPRTRRDPRTRRGGTGLHTPRRAVAAGPAALRGRRGRRVRTGGPARRDARPGSYLVLSHVTGDFDPEGAAKARAVYQGRGLTLRPRSREEFARFFGKLELVEPGVSLTAEWHPSWARPSPSAGTAPIPGYAAVARVP